MKSTDIFITIRNFLNGHWAIQNTNPEDEKIESEQNKISEQSENKMEQNDVPEEQEEEYEVDVDPYEAHEKMRFQEIMKEYEHTPVENILEYYRKHGFIEETMDIQEPAPEESQDSQDSFDDELEDEFFDIEAEMKRQKLFTEDEEKIYEYIHKSRMSFGGIVLTCICFAIVYALGVFLFLAERLDIGCVYSTIRAYISIDDFWGIIAALLYFLFFQLLDETENEKYVHLLFLYSIFKPQGFRPVLFDALILAVCPLYIVYFDYFSSRRSERNKRTTVNLLIALVGVIRIAEFAARQMISKNEVISLAIVGCIIMFWDVAKTYAEN